MLLAVIAFAAFCSTLAGGLLAYRLHDKLHLILGFSAGAVIGVAFFDLLPEALTFDHGAGVARATIGWAALGFLAYLVLDRMLPFHSRADEHPDDHGHAHDSGATVGTRGIAGAAVLCLHSCLDGMAIGVGFQASHAVGMVVAVAVLTHDFSDGINTMNVVLKNHGARRQGLSWLLADALAPSVGIAATFFFHLPAADTGFVLAVFAGFFLYIGASDLIPESYHAHPKFLTTAMTLAGAAVLYFAMTLAAVGAATTDGCAPTAPVRAHSGMGVVAARSRPVAALPAEATMMLRMATH